jgi:hypothetical protein
MWVIVAVFFFLGHIEVEMAFLRAVALGAVFMRVSP